MLDDFLTRAFVAGVGVALIAGPLGCFIIWRRLAYFGDTLAHAGLLGAALALAFQVDFGLSVFALSLTIAAALMFLQRRRILSSDALLGLLSHSALAIGLVTLSLMQSVRIDLMALLFGDILAVSRSDIAVIYGGGALVLAIMAFTWRQLIAATVNPELATAEGMRPEIAHMVFVVLIAIVIALAIKIVGVLLITAMLIIPAAAARSIAGSPEVMAIVAAAIGCLAVFGGLYGSLQWDTPSGASIVVAALGLFLASLAIGSARTKLGGMRT